MEVGFSGDGREGEFFGEEIHFQNVTFVHGVWKVATIASIMFGRGTNIPADLAVLTEGGARIGSNMGDNFGAKGGNGGAVVVKMTKKRGMS